MSEGIFFFVVGPSGAGKDALIDGAKTALSTSERYVFAQRTITRLANSPGEKHHAISETEFIDAEKKGHFLISWHAHGLHYGLSKTLLEDIQHGQHVIANGSRTVIQQLATLVPRLIVIEITAPVDVLAQRIAKRGRETVAEIQARLSRQAPLNTANIEYYQVMNDETVEEGISRFITVLGTLSNTYVLRRLPIHAPLDKTVYVQHQSHAFMLNPHQTTKLQLNIGNTPLTFQMHTIDDPYVIAPHEIGLSADLFDQLALNKDMQVSIRKILPPQSQHLLRRKINGQVLNQDDYAQLLREIIDGRYEDTAVAAFLVAATKSLTDDEVLALAKVRSSFSKKIEWNEPIVVDKHSMGGIPGSRITLIVVPIIAAFGMAMPKTSSRAITSAAGTADAMETVAKVDLYPQDVFRCVKQAKACIAWNVHLNHSVIDDVMNAITRPLGLESTRWSVASILSKKKTAGSTHVIVDIPYGPRTKLKTQEDAQQLAHLFEKTGTGLELKIKAYATDGTRPIGRGIGPALEVRDVEWVLTNNEQAPTDLRNKAILFASRILAWHPDVATEEKGREIAEQLLKSGAAKVAFERIIDAQGRKPRIYPGTKTHTVYANQSGQISELNGWEIAGVARAAGAPQDLSAGIDLLCQIGDHVKVGQPLYTIHSSQDYSLENAIQLSSLNNGILIQ